MGLCSALLLINVFLVHFSYNMSIFSQLTKCTWVCMVWPCPNKVLHVTFCALIVLWNHLHDMRWSLCHHVVGCLLGYAMGWGPITWLLMSEVLPLAARGVASGLCVTVSWLTAFMLTNVFTILENQYGLYVPYLLFTVVCVLCLLFNAVCIPETRGRSLEEIENYFRTRHAFTINRSPSTAQSSWGLKIHIIKEWTTPMVNIWNTCGKVIFFNLKRNHQLWQSEGRGCLSNKI